MGKVDSPPKHEANITYLNSWGKDDSKEDKTKITYLNSEESMTPKKISQI